MRLIIAEKPSVGQSIAHTLGITNKKDGYLEGEKDIVSWCIGHLVQLAPADFYNSAYSNWNIKDLPVIPQSWKYVVSPTTKKQYEILKKLMLDKSVDCIVCATDAGREGELIFRLVYNQCECNKPIKRLWISSMEESIIQAGFQNLKDSAEYDNLYQAALCRSHADWLVGINGTRLFSIIQGKTLHVGRVVTPTLAMITQREDDIANFKKEPYYTVILDCGSFTAESERIDTKKTAEAIANTCNHKSAIVISIEQSKKSEKPPLLYDLTTLQREANRVLGYTSQQTLDYLQALYEKKLVTYPRTDSRYLNYEMHDIVSPLAETVLGIFSFMEGLILPFHAETILDSTQVTDHHAIIPTRILTMEVIEALPSGEKNILTMVCVRLISALGEPYISTHTKALLNCNGYHFSASEKEVIQQGFQEVENAYKRTIKVKDKKKSTLPLPKLEQGQEFSSVKAKITEGKTTPPNHFTEDTLLAAMEHTETKAFTAIPNVERKGIGTPATRASIIEKLVKSQLIERKASGQKTKYLLPTEKARETIALLPDTIKSAKMTAEWENDLKKVEQGELSPNSFMKNISDYVVEIVNTYKDQEPKREVIGVCPICGKNIYENDKSFYCIGYKDSPSCSFALWKNNYFFQTVRKKLSKEIAKELLQNGRVFLTGLYSEKKQKYYDAAVVLAYETDENGKQKVKFKLDFTKQTKGELSICPFNS